MRPTSRQDLAKSLWCMAEYSQSVWQVQVNYRTLCPIHGFALSRLQSHPCHYADIRQRKTHVAAVKRLKHNKVLKVLTQRIIGPSNS